METVIYTFALSGHVVGVVQFEGTVQRRQINSTVRLAAVHIAHQDDGVLGSKRVKTLFQQFHALFTCLPSGIVKMGVCHTEHFASLSAFQYNPVDKARMAAIPSYEPCAVG